MHIENRFLKKQNRRKEKTRTCCMKKQAILSHVKVKTFELRTSKHTQVYHAEIA